MIKSKTLCVNGGRYFHQVRIQQIPAPLHLLAHLRAQESLPKAYWHGRDGTEVACCGSALMLHDPPRFDSGNESSARFWGGHAFFPSKPFKDATWKGFPRCGFFLPKMEIIRKRGATTLIQHAINGPIPDPVTIIPSEFEYDKAHFQGDAHLPTKEAWNALIQEGIKQIRETLLDKVVLGRRSTHNSQCPLDPFAMLAQIEARSEARFAFQFANQVTFIGATPERLYLREGRQLHTEAIAGTCPIGMPASTLLDSEKERREFEIVKESIREQLSALCEELSCRQEDTIVETPTVQHLYNPFTARLKEGVEDRAILAALHPTAAMGGFPKSEALTHLEKHEPFERGWYASPIGYISEGEAEMCVGIRSALVEKDTMHLFAAAGIVEGSAADQEWEELDRKIALWKA